VLQIPVTRLLTRYRRTRSVALGATVFATSFVAYAVLGVVSTGTALVIGVFVATAAFTVGELMHGATASAMVASAAPAETRGRHLAVYQLSWAVPTALAPAVLTGLLTASPTGMWLVLATAVGGAAAGVLRLEPRLPRAAVRPGTPEPEPGSTGAETTEPEQADPSRALRGRLSRPGLPAGRFLSYPGGRIAA
ncbi:MFS transporter, partial [Actinoplanes nipponensis]|uniref:MFS transporter n=1 Tax=Actinoplanes nipponensis TaxID=135950 RepID=UPI0031EBDBE8